jgi:heme-degrading monooxygenase HmoA
MNRTIESVVVALAPGRSEEEFLKACTATESFLKEQPGFMWRRIVKLDPGRYMDILEWRSQAEADAAMKASMSEASMATLMNTLDPHSVVVAHYPVVSAL